MTVSELAVQRNCFAHPFVAFGDTFAASRRRGVDPQADNQDEVGGCEKPGSPPI